MKTWLFNPLGCLILWTYEGTGDPATLQDEGQEKMKVCKHVEMKKKLPGIFIEISFD